MNALLFERPVWFATGPLVLEEEPQEMEDFTYHRPVLAAEAVELLAPHPGSLVVDGTVGGGGHTEAILKIGVDVLALDQDPDAIEQAREELAHFGGRVTLRQINFREADKILDELGVEKIGGALLDLGVSSRQLENAARGFSMMRNGPLDMRMDRESGVTAADLVNTLPVDDLGQVIRDYGDERFARAIASAIGRARAQKPITRTEDLRGIVEATVPRRFWPKRIHPATRTFQALRIAVNHELESLERGLQASIHILRPGGRLGVISFHSLEDTLVKNALHVAAQNCVCPPQQPHCTCAHRATLLLLNRKAIRPDVAELAANPRSRSARLRVAEKLDNKS